MAFNGSGVRDIARVIKMGFNTAIREAPFQLIGSITLS
jgi:hypothetical protein